MCARRLGGALNGDIFRANVEQTLAPTLSPGDIVVMDNLPCYKVAGIQEAIESREARLLYLPPYGPDLLPSNRPSPNSVMPVVRRPATRVVIFQ